MNIATIRNGLPKYLYTPSHQRAFLLFTYDVQGKVSAGYQVWLDMKAEDIFQQTFNYGPYVNECMTIEEATIKLFNAYQLWQEEQRGLQGR